jgi:DNA invertase Pin-like site-specific DNA recombinase
MNIGYVRVSSVDQNEARQVEGLQKYGIEKFFIEKITAKDTNRPQLRAMLDFAREGDTIHVLDFSRLARSTEDLLRLVREMKSKGIRLISAKENLDTETPAGKMMLTMLAAIYEFERDTILERQREGIAIAKREGKYKGRKPVNIKPETFNEQYERYLRREITKAKMAQNLGITRPTLDKLIKQYTG